MQHTLYIFLNYTKVGDLLFESKKNEFSLKYEEDWIQNGFPISNILGFDYNFSSLDIKNFIENLLPEGDGLERLVNYFQISKTNKFALLQQIGSETSGALSFLKEDNLENIKTTFREISNEELVSRIKKRKEIPITIWDEKPRLSIAGVQEKLPICKIGEKYGFGDGELASTHILKFDKGDENLVLNEYFSLQLAKAMGIEVPNCEIKNFADEFVLEIERFDRKIISDTKIEKLHIIDSLQVLNLPVSFKYERNFGNGRDVKNIREGVSFLKLETITKLTKLPIITKKALLEWSIVNLILGNSDAHGKNISFFIDNKGLSIAPFYDIVNISLYEGKYDTSMAMGIDDEFALDILTPYSVAAHCYSLDIKPKLFQKSFESCVDKMNESFEAIFEKIIVLNETFAKNYKNNLFKRIEKLQQVIKQASKFKKEDI